jgi:hypothetical protein
MSGAASGWLGGWAASGWALGVRLQPQSFGKHPTHNFREVPGGHNAVPTSPLADTSTDGESWESEGAPGMNSVPRTLTGPVGQQRWAGREHETQPHRRDITPTNSHAAAQGSKTTNIRMAHRARGRGCSPRVRLFSRARCTATVDSGGCPTAGRRQEVAAHGACEGVTTQSTNGYAQRNKMQSRGNANTPPCERHKARGLDLRRSRAPTWWV